nr:hypothetical protein [Geoalkalibacter sp.]
MRVLSADLVEAKGGEQTDDAMGNQLGRLSQAVVSGDLGVGRHVKAAPGPHHQPLPAQAAQILWVDAARGQVADPQDTHLAGEFQDGFRGRRIAGHV